MASEYPRDQFDDVPADFARVGAHRGPARRGRGWIAFAWAALATGVLVAGGLFGIAAINNTGDVDLGAAGQDTPEPTATSTIVPVTDPTAIKASRNITVSILNGTPVTNLGSDLYKKLHKAGWPVQTSVQADKSDIKKTIVYYTKAKDEDVALGLVAALGAGEARVTTAALGASLRIVIGSDYATLVGAK